MRSKSKLVGFVHPGSTADGFPFFPFEFLYLAAFLEENGYEAIIIDQRTDDDWLAQLEDVVDQLLWLGVTAISGNQVTHALEVSQAVRNLRPDLPIVWGGWHATFVPETTIIHPLVDYVVAGIGELKILELTEYIANGQTGPIENTGILHVDHRVSYLPFKEKFEEIQRNPAYHLIDLDKYRSERNLATVITSRGCPFRCRFCTISQVSYINRDISLVVDELDYLITEKGFEEVIFADGLFFAQRSRVLKMLDAIEERGLKFKWGANTRPETFSKWTDTEMRRLMESGLKSVSIGAESGSPEVLSKIVQKDAGVEDIFSAAEITYKYGIILSMYFLTGMPGENVEDLKLTVDAVDELYKRNPDMKIFNSVYQPIPGAPTYSDMLEMGWQPPKTLEEWGESVRWGQEFSEIRPFPWLDSSQFVDYMEIFENSAFGSKRQMHYT
jgi:anaerobic magnesium-protoporphyrin IX monomethyl ester cyclase